MERLSLRQQDALELLYQNGAHIEFWSGVRDWYAFVRTPDQKTHNVFINTFDSLQKRGLIERDMSKKDFRYSTWVFRYSTWVISDAGRELIAPLLCHCLEDDCTRVHSPAPETA